MTQSQRRAPALRRIRVEGIKLYNDGGVLDVELTSPISAFVGANGIGKSTLLALANFGMTGLVPNGGSAFPSVEEFAERTTSFAAAYFAGRVEESDRDTATVTVEFSLGASVFEVTRGLFEGRLVRRFTVAGIGSTGKKTVEADVQQSSSDLAIAFQKEVVQASGLANFEQFSFWQLFMMTFDERRHLLFWDEKTLQSALMISLGRSPQDAIEAEGLSRNIERQDSLARNARWRATQATNKRRKLARDAAHGSELTDEEFLALKQKRDDLVQSERVLKKRLEAKELELRDTSRTVAELAITESTLEQTYLDSFSKPSTHRLPTRHPAISGILTGGLCDLCGSQTHSLGLHASEALNRGECPLCDHEFQVPLGGADDHSDLIRLDERLASARKAVNEARARYHRLRDESATSAREWEESWRELDAFLGSNANLLDQEQVSTYHEEFQQYDREIAAAMKDAEEYRSVRDGYRARLEPIISGLVEGYEQIEKVFVPNFRRLAEQFIGRSVDVEFERRGVNIGLRFALDGQSRRTPSELSESQQYFLDIALRMSLIQTFISENCTLLVDTPEGSLDIAYETRAGMLFDQFSKSGYSLIMMSNLNASNLLSELAKLSTPEGMKIFKMIEWARLSDVQLQSSSLFDEVYHRLDGILRKTMSKA